MENAGCRDQPAEVGHVGDGAAYDEGEGPVDGHGGTEEDLAALGLERGEFEEFLKYVGVDDLDTDVPVQGRGNQGGDQSDDVGDRLPGKGAETLIDRDDDELTLIGVDKDAEEKVDDKDEGLRTQHSLPEIPRTFHFRHELNEQHRSAVGVYGLHEADNLARERNAIGNTGVMNDGTLYGFVLRQSGRIVGWRVGGNTHAKGGSASRQEDTQLAGLTS